MNAIKFSSIQVISPAEIQFTLAETTNMTGQKIQVVNPDGSQDTYFSYMRGIPLAQSNQPLLAGAVPIFSPVTHSWAEFTSMAPASNTQFTGIAVQNPSVAPASVAVALYSSANALLGSPPGTSKTELSKEIARFIGWPHLAVDPSFLLRNGMDGIQAEANTIFRMLEETERVVVLFDEFDEFVRGRDGFGISNHGSSGSRCASLR